jgi:hypothetical protein
LRQQYICHLKLKTLKFPCFMNHFLKIQFKNINFI